MDQRALELFLELHRGLPRQAPGGREHTLRALGDVPDLPEEPRIIDLGCGPGAHTVDLLQAREDATVVAVDQLPDMLDELRRRAEVAEVADRLTLVEGDIGSLPPEVKRAWFHLVWSEGAAYSIGFDRALRSWRHLLVPGGFIAVSELAWWVPVGEAPDEARAFFDEAYPAMREDSANRAAFEASGFELVSHFALPPWSWWDPYYGPIVERLSAFEAAHPDDPIAREVAEAERREIEIFESYGDAFAYVFYVGRMR